MSDGRRRLFDFWMAPRAGDRDYLTGDGSLKPKLRSFGCQSWTVTDSLMFKEGIQMMCKVSHAWLRIIETTW